MQLRLEAFTRPKLGCSPEQNEDSFWPGPGWFAVPLSVTLVDGATEGFLSRQWSQYLSRFFAEEVNQTTCSALQNAWPETSLRLQQGWQKVKSDYLRARLQSGLPLKWYEEASLEKTVHATVLKVMFRAGLSGLQAWALSLGDCLMFAPASRHEWFPRLTGSDFGNAPTLWSSQPHPNPLTQIRSSCWVDCRPGERLYLATDALAHWLIVSLEKGLSPWSELEAACRSQADFEHWVEEKKARGGLRDDDVTLLRLSFPVDGPSFPAR